jgi:two-component system, NarL family, nitrate/nitrite sensor histidine kinase NarX
MAQHGGRRPVASRRGADDQAGALPAAVVRGPGPPISGAAAPAPEFEAALSPMLEAVVDMAGATAGALRVVGADGLRLEPGIAVGLPAGMGRTGAGAIAFWCSRCIEATNPESECVKSRLCGAEERFSVDLAGPACRHVVAVPLKFRGAAVGTLDLLFESECALPPETMPLLGATGELIGVALENARLTRENLRASLVAERQTMANEVHDSLAQGLTYMRMRMSLLRDAIKQGDELRAFKYWSDVDDSLTQAHRRLRELITYFRSRMDPKGLQHALAETAASFHGRTGVELDFANAVPELQLPVGREVEVFHIVQEALSNVTRHANARHARLTLRRGDAGYEVVVEDDGVGMPHDAAGGDPGDAGHYGIAIMRERARRLGGELRLESIPGGGTRVGLQFPVEPPQGETTP